MKNELFKFSRSTSLSFDDPINLYFILDNSPSMDDEVEGTGKTRFEIQNEQMLLTLSRIFRVVSNKKVPVDLAICFVNGDEYIERDFDVDSYTTLKSMLESAEIDLVTGTPYNVPMAKARTYFLAETRSNYRRICFFVTDGEPYPIGSAAQAASENADMINGTGTFETYPVEIYGIGIDLIYTEYLELLDNTGGVTSLDTSKTDSIYKLFFDIINDPIKYYFTSGDMDIEYDGNIYLSIPMERKEFQVNSGIDVNIKIHFSINNNFARMWLVNQYEEFLTVEVIEKIDSTYETKLTARLSQVKMSNSEVILYFVNNTSSLRRTGLKRVYEKLCPHTLYSRGCNLYSGDFQAPGYVTAINGLEFTVPIAGSSDDGFFTFGYIENMNGVRRFIEKHVGSTLTLESGSQEYIDEFDSDGWIVVNIYPGCNKNISTCRIKFNNGVNYGGHIGWPSKDIFKGVDISLEY